MFNTNNTVLLILAIVIIFFIMRNTNFLFERFSSSGLAISDRYCTRLADVYYHPQVKCPTCRDNYLERICGKKRRHTVDEKTGNYFTQYGKLV